MSKSPSSPLGLDRHNHGDCVRVALASAERTCADLNLQFTATRRRVLEILLEHHTALGAYEVLDRLNAEGMGAKPPIAYRALGFLVDHGLAHRIEKLNAFVACAHPGVAHDPAFLICRKCHSVGEQTSCCGLTERATRAGFAAEHTIAEVVGLCGNCQTKKETGV